MAYSADREPGELTALTVLATDDVFVVGDASDASEVAKHITKANLKTDLFNTPTLVTPVIGAATGTSLQLSGLTASEIVVTDGSKNLASAAVATYPSLTELSYVKGVTSAVQTQLNAKAPVASPTFTGTVTLPVGLTGVVRADSGVVSVDTDVTDIVAAASDIAAGKVELATDAETVTGTATDRATTPANVTARLASPSAIGSTTPSTGKFTTVETTGGIELGHATDTTLTRTGAGAIAVEGVAVLLSGGALGTPSSGTLTNCTGLPLAGVVDSTSEALGVGSLEVGHASDTTITRVSAGLIAVEGSNLIRASDVDDTPVNGETAVPVSSNWAFDHAALASSDTVVGHVELATAAETTTGTSATLAVTPDGLAGSTAFGRKTVSVQVFDGTTDVTVGDGKAYIVVPEALNGMDVVRAIARVITAGTTNATTIDIYNVTDSVDILSTAISVASGGTLATAGTVNTSNDSLATNDLLRIDVTSVSTTPPKGLIVVIEAQLP